MSIGFTLRAALRVAMVAAVAAVSACGVFDEEEERLPGDRIPVRSVDAAATMPEAQAQELAALGPATPLVDWPQPNAASTRAPGHIAGPRGLGVAWRTDIGDGASGDARLTSEPVVLGGRVYALDAAAQVTAVDAASGRVIWRASVAPEGEDGEDGFGGGLAAAEGRVFVATGFGEVVALGAGDGAQLWRQTLGAPLRSAPAVDGGRVFVVTRDNSGFALDAASGDVLWRVLGARGGAGLLGGASPAASGELVVLPFLSGELVAVRASTGRQVWADALTGGRRGVASADISDITGDPVIAGAAVFASNQSGQMVALDGRTGRRGWLRPYGSANPAWTAGATLFLVTLDGQLIRIAAATGELLWATDLARYSDPDDREGAIAYGGPVVADGRVYVTSSEEGLLTFDAQTGVAGPAVDLAGTSVGPVIAGGALYVLTNDAELVALR